LKYNDSLDKRLQTIYQELIIGSKFPYLIHTKEIKNEILNIKTVARKVYLFLCQNDSILLNTKTRGFLNTIKDQDILSKFRKIS
jgi:hypothetical protein